MRVTKPSKIPDNLRHCQECGVATLEWIPASDGKTVCPDCLLQGLSLDRVCCIKYGKFTEDWVALKGKPICRSHVGISPGLDKANREAARNA